jgi:hypothetical protein
LGAVVGGLMRAGASSRRDAALVLVGVLAAVALAWPEQSALTLDHVHNWLGLWLAWARASQ